MSPQNRHSFGARVNAWLQEATGEIFYHGKWRFWFIAVVVLSVLNSILTAVIFGTGDNAQEFMGAIILAVGGLIAWLAVGCLHYSDSPDRRLARGVAALDSLTLLFVAVHFAFLAWTLGHLITLQNAEKKYEAAAARYNAEDREVSGDNVKIAASAERIAQETTKTARLENDSIYQQRRAAEAGAPLPRRRRAPAAAVGPALATSQIELERPVKPEESSAAFLTKWDAWIRAANLAELLLAIATLIFIRNQTAKTNSPRVIYDTAEEFPRELDAQATAPRKRENFTKKKDTAKTHASFNSEGLRRLREALRDISFRLHKFSFKVDIRGDAVWIRMVYARQGTQETAHSVRAKLSILDDAVVMPQEQFRERLERFLKSNGFEI